jgi:hypothetical protein
VAADEFLTLPRRVGLAKLGAAKCVRFYYRAKGGIPVEKDADVGQLTRTFEKHPQMRMRVRLSDSQHFVVISATKRLEHGYEVFF